MSVVPTYHNICGRRTIYRRCDCAICNGGETKSAAREHNERNYPDLMKRIDRLYSLTTHLAAQKD